MEKFFIVTPASTLHKEYFDYLKNTRDVNERIKSFFNTNGIETKEYYCSNDRLYIVPTQKDEGRFAKQLRKYSDSEGLRAFNKKSFIGKTWVVFMKDLVILHRPFVQCYFNCCGRSRYRLFESDGVFYCSYSTESETLDNPIGFKEIKGSEFYKVLEKD